MSVLLSQPQSLGSTGLRGNPLILWGVVLEIVLILLIDYTPWGNRLLETAPTGLSVWLLVVPFALGLLTLEELPKLLVRRMRAGAGLDRRPGEAVPHDR